MQLSEIKEHLARFLGCSVGFHRYGEFGSILRLRIADQEENDWYLSFGGCSYVQGQVMWELGPMSIHGDEDDRLLVEDPDGSFKVICQSCHLIHEDAYLDALRKNREVDGDNE